MLASEKLAVAAHLHVLLRRKTGRVTDTEWMAVNVEYAAEVVRFARQRASEDGHPDLADWADKLAQAMGLAAAPATSPAAASAPETRPSLGSSVRAPAEAADDAPRYIGGLR